jgi:hypothetical protein
MYLYYKNTTFILTHIFLDIFLHGLHHHVFTGLPIILHVAITKRKDTVLETLLQLICYQRSSFRCTVQTKADANAGRTAAITTIIMMSSVINSTKALAYNHYK